MKVSITLDVVSFDIPLHISKVKMERVEINLNYRDNKITALERKAELTLTTAGHPL